MREPSTKQPRPLSSVESRRLIAECEAFLSKRNISPEMREALTLRVSELRQALAAESRHRERDPGASGAE